jgi:tripartite-type tricarboxylate transporter receptor subunit TctC
MAMRHATGVLSAVMFAAYAAFAASPAQAEYPEKTIRILSPYSAGGGTDIVARAIGPV